MAYFIEKNVQQKIDGNPAVKSFTVTSPYFHDLVSCLNDFFDPFMKISHLRKIQQSHVFRYTDEPEGCNKKIPMMIYSPLDNDGEASGNAWVAKIPLLPNFNSVAVYFPDQIIVYRELFRHEIAKGENKDHRRFAIPLVLSDFVQNPEHFLSIDKIKQRIKIP